MCLKGLDADAVLDALLEWLEQMLEDLDGALSRCQQATCPENNNISISAEDSSVRSTGFQKAIAAYCRSQIGIIASAIRAVSADQ